jgi:hypothetical protein
MSSQVLLRSTEFPGLRHMGPDLQAVRVAADIRRSWSARVGDKALLGRLAGLRSTRQDAGSNQIRCRTEPPQDLDREGPANLNRPEQ